ncbi:unnamed protein product [Pocillopora meandrina]|uniref:Uncharacterized protein n=1 Tax=Pocillopora meandrina TaxID=46732 RepID=A0AAU9VKE5_9CNID|nr:unnamed protein product [Pocillopora meandrina]
MSTIYTWSLTDSERMIRNSNQGFGHVASLLHELNKKRAYSLWTKECHYTMFLSGNVLILCNGLTFWEQSRIHSYSLFSPETAQFAAPDI